VKRERLENDPASNCTGHIQHYVIHICAPVAGCKLQEFDACCNTYKADERGEPPRQAGIKQGQVNTKWKKKYEIAQYLAVTERVNAEDPEQFEIDMVPLPDTFGHVCPPGRINLFAKNKITGEGKNHKQVEIERGLHGDGKKPGLTPPRSITDDPGVKRGNRQPKHKHPLAFQTGIAASVIIKKENAQQHNRKNNKEFF